jgi:hypothetical protein
MVLVAAPAADAPEPAPGAGVGLEPAPAPETGVDLEPTPEVEQARGEEAADQLAAGLDQAKQFQEEGAAAVHGHVYVVGAGGERFTLKSELSRQLMQEALALEQLEE